jgi:hypothetical protein
VNSALEIRIYAFAGEFDGHRTSLTGFKLAEFTATPFVVPGAAVARTRGGTPSAATLATVTDDEDPPGTLVVTATAVPTGISITNIANNNGTITATVGASCSITNGAKVVTLQAQNSAGTTSTANFTVNVASNTVPTLGTYGDVTIAAGGSTTVTPSAPPADNGTVTVTPTASSGYTGTLTANSTTGVVSIGNANAGTFTITVAAKDNCNANAVSKTFTLTVNGSLAAPAGFTATATQPNSVSVVWSTVPGATSYEVQRTEFITNAFAPLSPTVTVTNFTDTTVTGNKSYLYRVRALAGGLASPFSAVDVATTVIFSDPALGSGTTVIKAAHIAELRTAVAAMRTAAVLGAATFADNPLTATTKVKASHITELRTALDQARSSLGLTPALTYTDSAITAGTTKVKAVHVQQLRDGVK